MKITARATPNIAFIKYWGNRNDALRLCAADSCSMTLDSPSVDITVESADVFSVTSKNKEMKEKDIVRFQTTVDLIQQYLTASRSSVPTSIAIEIDSHIPTSIGIASSAAVFAALAKAISGLMDAELSDEQVSVMARLGSGSAARSIFGGYGAIRNLPGDGIGDAIGWQIAEENHWVLHDVIIVPSTEEKKVGSTEGHAGAHTSPHFADRIRAIGDHRQRECVNAILEKDFEKLQAVVEEDCMDMHRCMQTQTPPLQYLSGATYRIIEEITALRKAKHLPVLYTMDAGPTVHLFCTDEALNDVRTYAKAQKGCKIFEARTGSGASLL